MKSFQKAFEDRKRSTYAAIVVRATTIGECTGYECLGFPVEWPALPRSLLPHHPIPFANQEHIQNDKAVLKLTEPNSMDQSRAEDILLLTFDM